MNTSQEAINEHDFSLLHLHSFPLYYILTLCDWFPWSVLFQRNHSFTVKLQVDYRRRRCVPKASSVLKHVLKHDLLLQRFGLTDVVSFEWMLQRFSWCNVFRKKSTLKKRYVYLLIVCGQSSSVMLFQKHEARKARFPRALYPKCL